jgi:hypothetical protein
VNDGKEVEGANNQVMRCIMCFDDLVNVPNPRTKDKKGSITYYKTYSKFFLNKHVDVDHSIIVKKIEKKLNNLIIESVKKQLAKKRLNVPGSAISIIFTIKKPLLRVSS